MKIRLMFCYFCFIFLVFLPSVVLGSGYAINEQSTRVIGRGALTGEFKDIYAHIFGINVSYKF